MCNLSCVCVCTRVEKGLEDNREDNSGFLAVHLREMGWGGGGRRNSLTTWFDLLQ